MVCVLDVLIGWLVVQQMAFGVGGISRGKQKYEDAIRSRDQAWGNGRDGASGSR